FNRCPNLLTYPLFFFFNDPATTEIYTLSLHDALPIYRDNILKKRDEIDYSSMVYIAGKDKMTPCGYYLDEIPPKKQLYFLYTSEDRKSTRLNSSHVKISYAVFCLKKKKKKKAKKKKK